MPIHLPPPKIHIAKDGDLASRGPQIVAISKHNRTDAKFSALVSGLDVPVAVATAPSVVSHVTFNPPNHQTEWTKADEQMLQKLILRKATGKITNPELKALEQHKAMKRALNYPQTAAAILQKHKEAKALKILLIALDNYVEVIGAPGD